MENKGKNKVLTIILILVTIITIISLIIAGIVIVTTSIEKDAAVERSILLNNKVSELENNESILKNEITKLNEKINSNSEITFSNIAGMYEYNTGNEEDSISLYLSNNGTFVIGLCYGGYLGSYTIENDNIVLNKFIYNTTSTDKKPASGQVKLKYKNKVLSLENASEIQSNYYGNATFVKKDTIDETITNFNDNYLRKTIEQIILQEI